jgi:hypothetical protein
MQGRRADVRPYEQVRGRGARRSGGKFASARGPSASDTIRAAQDALVKVGGTLAADSIVTVVCNTK